MRTALLAACLAVLPSLALAQGTTTIAWDYLKTPPATVATYAQSLSIDGVAAAGAPTCAASGVNTTCRQTVPALAAGVRTIRVEATANGVTAGTTATINPASGPQPPSGLRIEVNVVVTTP